MADEYITRKEIEKWIKTEMASIDTEDDRKFVIERLREEIPAADVAPVRHGRWEKNYDGIMTWWECSECHLNAWYDGYNLYDYCPDCGAKMEVDE